MYLKFGHGHLFTKNIYIYIHIQLNNQSILVKKVSM